MEAPWNNNKLIKVNQLFACGDIQQAVKERQKQQLVAACSHL